MPMKRCKPAAGRFPTPRVPRANMGDLYHIDADGIVTLSAMRELELLPVLFTLPPIRRWHTFWHYEGFMKPSWSLLLGVHFCPPITIRLQNRLGCYGMTYFKGSYIEASFFKTTFNFRRCHCCKVLPSIGRPMDRRYFNRVAASTIFFKNFSTNFFFRLYFGLFRRLPIRGTIFRKP